jgi:hypothetical protein
VLYIQYTTGQQNIALGYNALQNNTEGTNNVALGQNALFKYNRIQ